MIRVSLITVLLIICLILSSCCFFQPQTEVYNILINEEVRSHNNLDVDKFDTFVMNGKQYVNNNTSQEKVVQILDESYCLTYQYSVSSNIYGECLDYYYCENMDCQIAYSTETGALLRLVSKKPNGITVPVEVTLFSTDEYFSWLHSIIESTLEVDVADYILICQTYYIDGTYDSTFVPSSMSEEKQVDFYYVEYAKYIGKYKSAEIVKVISQPDGSIKSLIHSILPDTVFDHLSVSEDKLSHTIEKTVNDIFASKNIIKTYTVKSMIWQCYKGDPYLMCGVEVMSVDHSGEEIGYSVIIAIEP